MKLIATAILVMLCASCLVLAQDPKAKDAGPDLQARFTRTDENKDGKVTFEEVKILLAERLRAVEKARSKGAKQSELEDIVKKYADIMELEQFLKSDTDDDLALTQAEVKAAMTKGLDKLKYSAKDLDSIIEFNWVFDMRPFDTNRNSELERAEWPDDQLKKFFAIDANSDTVITKDEFVEYCKNAKWYKDLLAESGGAAPAGESNFALYSKVGRNWTTRTTKAEAKQPTFMQYEITQVYNDRAEVTTTTLDKDKKEVPGSSQTSTVEFKGKVAMDPKAKVEKIKVEAGEFECTVTDEGGTKTWRSKKYPQLLVKSVSKDGKTTVELIDFRE